MKNQPEGDRLADAVKKLDMHVAAAGIHGSAVTPEAHVNNLPERAARYGEQVAEDNKRAGAAGTGEEDNSASTHYANQTLEKAAGWIPVPVDKPEELDLTEDMRVKE